MIDPKLSPSNPLLAALAQQLGHPPHAVAEALARLGSGEQVVAAQDPRLLAGVQPDTLYPNLLVTRMLGVSPSTLRRLRAEAGVEPLRLPHGRRLIWTGRQVLALMAYIRGEGGQ